MTAKGLMANPAEVNKLGDFERVNAILVGRVTSMNGNLDLTVWGVSIKTAERVASGKITLPMAKDWQGMLTRSVSDGSSSESPAAARSDASIAEGPVLSSTDLGPVTVVLRNVVEQKLPTDRGEVPAIQCSFEVENRDTKRWVAIAANQRVQEDSGYRADSAGYRGGLVDSNQVSWSLVEVTGVSAVRCFEFSTQRITQNNPGAIVDYIRNGKRSEGKAAHFDKGHFWSGSLEFIPPLGRTRVTAVFTPPTPAASKRSRSREEPEKVAPWKQLEFGASPGTSEFTDSFSRYSPHLNWLLKTALAMIAIGIGCMVLGAAANGAPWHWVVVVALVIASVVAAGKQSLPWIMCALQASIISVVLQGVLLALGEHRAAVGAAFFTLVFLPALASMVGLWPIATKLDALK